MQKHRLICWFLPCLCCVLASSACDEIIIFVRSGNGCCVVGDFVQGRSHIFKIHAAKMSVEKDIRFELLARLCPNSTGMCVGVSGCVGLMTDT